MGEVGKASKALTRPLRRLSAAHRVARSQASSMATFFFYQSHPFSPFRANGPEAKGAVMELFNV